MEPVIHKTTTTSSNPSRQAAVNALAIVGFIVLVIVGIWLAIYAARFVPETIGRLGAANVYFSSLFGGEEEDNDLEVVPGDSVPFEDDDEPVATSTPTTNDDEPKTDTPVAPPAPAAPRAPATPRVTTYPVAVPQALYGKADLIVKITEIGYLNTSSTASFVKSNEVPENKRPAVKFRVTNVGTNTTGSWEFDAKLPTSSTYTFSSPTQQSLLPTQHIDYVLGYDRAKDGENRFTITVDSDEDVDESNENNNVESVTIEVED